MESGYPTKISRACDRWLFKSILVLLFLAILVTIMSIAASTSIFSENHAEEDGKNSQSVISQDKDLPHHQSVPGQYFNRHKHGHHSEEADTDIEEEWTGISERPESRERDVREVKDLPLMLVKHKVRHPSRKPCSRGLYSLHAEATRRVQRRKAFLYLQKLYQALASWTELADQLGDTASAKWAIRAYSPVLKSSRSVVFQPVSESACQVTHRELVIGLRCCDIPRNQGYITVGVNGRPVNRTTGTFFFPHAAVFNLTNDSNISNVNISVNNFKCFTAVQLSYSMLFEFCSINQTMRNYFKEIVRELQTHKPIADKGHAERKRVKDDKQIRGLMLKNSSSCVDCLNETETEHGENRVDKTRANATAVNDTRTFEESSKDWIMANVPLFAERLSRVTPITLEKLMARRSTSSPSHHSASAARPTSRRPPPPPSSSSSSLLSKLSPEKPPASVLATVSPYTDTQRAKRDVSCTSCQQRTGSPARTCVRQEMKVHLYEDLHFPILMPARPVDVGMCHGTCIHACHMGQADENINITAHAVLLNLLAGKEGASARWGPGVRMSSCVPHRMKTMSVLRVSPHNSFRTEIVNWPNMVIDTCRCA